ncbi:MAG: hypothetical protein EAY81_06000 [Bacteroidetes bacterium]|nr:MAG: hypothetical protein EAY81_06000 [Bacteroidota bacterium]
MSELKDIPKHWEIKKLGEVCLKVDTVKRKDKNPEEEFLYLDIGGIDNSTNKILSYKNYQWKDAPSRAQQIVYIDDVLFSTVRTYMKNIAIVEKKVFDGQIASSGFAVIRGNMKIANAKFIFYYSLSQKFLQPLNELQTGSSYPAVRDKDVFSQPFPLPPLSEQQAIVAKIEELLSELENGKQQLLTAQQQLKVYRQSLLKWAFEGKLTKVKGEWRKIKLGEVANAVDPQPSHRTPPIVPNGIPYVSIKDFDSELDKIDLEGARKVSPDVLKEHLNRYTLQLGDFVIGKIGTIGKPVRIVLPQNYSLSANIVLIQPRKINPTYLYYFFQSNQIEKAFKAGTNSTTQAAFGIQKVRELVIDLPNEDEQNLIVSELESKLTVCDKIEETISQSLQQAETLKQSILKKAFEGRLV